MRREAGAKLNENPILALTLEEFSGALLYPVDINGGKGGTRTLDPGIMSAVL
jgi:hypothetical protein